MSASNDRYRNFRFRMKWRGRYVAGFAEISALPDKTTSAGHLRSGRPRPSVGPEGQGTPFFISLKDGVSYDLGFEQWVSMVRSFGPATGKGSLLPEYKTPLTIEEYDEQGAVKGEYHLSDCWVAEYRAVPGPDEGSLEIAVEHMKLGFGSWTRDLPEGK
jgi:phage tail-like protein